MSRARRLLFISPVMPAETGNGLAMRAGVFLDALAADHQVSLLVVPVAGPADEDAIPPWVSSRVADVVVMPTEGRVDGLFGLIARLKDPAARAQAILRAPRPLMCRFATSGNVAAVAARLGDPRFDVLHVLRLYMAPFAAPFLGAGKGAARPVAVLDLDDDEPRTHRRLSDVLARRGRADDSAIEAGEAGKYERLEREWLPRFDRVLVCSDADRAALTARLPHGRIEVIANAVREPMLEARPSRATEAGGLHESGVLLVGSFGYFPNEDAALFFGEEVWPRLVAEARHPVRAWLVGSRPSDAVLRLGRRPDISVTGRVPSVAPYYERVTVAVNPIRAGGGTRIKAIEAFAHGVPLVSTSAGAEGLAVEPGRHLLLADTAEGFARACLRLVDEPGLAASLAERARAVYLERYALAPVAASIRAMHRAAARAGRRDRLVAGE